MEPTPPPPPPPPGGAGGLKGGRRLKGGDSKKLQKAVELASLVWTSKIKPYIKNPLTE